MSLEQRQNLVQTQRLSQSMLQSLGVLQKQSAELAALVREELENNPLLEEVDEPPPAPESDSREERAEGDSDLFEATERLADGEAAGDGKRAPLDAMMDNYERELIVEAIKRNNENLSAAGRELGISPRMMTYRMHRLGIRTSRS